MRNVCSSISAGIKFLRYSESLAPQEALRIAKDAVLSLEFNKNFLFISTVIELCASDSFMFEDDKTSEIAEGTIIINFLYAKGLKIDFI